MHQSETALVLPEQLRQKIGVVYGNPETATGGNALKFYASVRLDIRKTGTVKNGEQVVGNKTRVQVVKNKVAPPFRECAFEIMYGGGPGDAGHEASWLACATLLPWCLGRGEVPSVGDIK